MIGLGGTFCTERKSRPRVGVRRGGSSTIVDGRGGGRRAGRGTSTVRPASAWRRGRPAAGRPRMPTTSS